jgi:CRISPR/Cas system Type II protein with McrA/HNH and RuvC-like nuclease domain
MKDQILKLRAEGKSYREIEKILGCSKSTIAYHCNESYRKKSIKRSNELNKLYPLSNKIVEFKSGCLEKSLQDFSIHDVRKKFGDNPKCYWTGLPIDLNNGSEYQLDHLIPRKKGGVSSLDNLVLSSRDANQCKYDLLPEEFLTLCERVLINHGYKIEKIIKDQP